MRVILFFKKKEHNKDQVYEYTFMYTHLRSTDTQVEIRKLEETRYASVMIPQHVRFVTHTEKKHKHFLIAKEQSEHKLSLHRI